MKKRFETHLSCDSLAKAEIVTAKEVWFMYSCLGFSGIGEGERADSPAPLIHDHDQDILKRYMYENVPWVHFVVSQVKEWTRRTLWNTSPITIGLFYPTQSLPSCFHALHDYLEHRRLPLWVTNQAIHDYQVYWMNKGSIWFANTSNIALLAGWEITKRRTRGLIWYLVPAWFCAVPELSRECWDIIRELALKKLQIC